jgi:hypothetical protein
MYKPASYIKLSLLAQRAAWRAFLFSPLRRCPSLTNTLLRFRVYSACPELGVSKKLISAYVVSGVFRIYPVMLVVSGVFRIYPVMLVVSGVFQIYPVMLVVRGVFRNSLVMLV